MGVGQYKCKKDQCSESKQEEGLQNRQCVDIRYIEELLWQRSPNTTMIHPHVSDLALKGIKGPLDIQWYSCYVEVVPIY